MHRQHFELERGYLNIDHDALVFTRSGNWQEAVKARERSSKLDLARPLRLVSGICLIVIGGLFLSMGELRHLFDGGSFVLAIGVGGLGVYKMYQLLGDEMGGSYRIPFNKLLRMTERQGLLEIEFLDRDHKIERMAVGASKEAAQFAAQAWKASRSPE